MAANPYVQGWREWDERYADLVLGKRNWQVATGCSLLVSLVLSIGIVWLALRSRYVPYVVVTDRLGQAITIPKPLTPASMPVVAARMERWEIESFINDARSVSSDPAVEQERLASLHAHARGAADRFLDDYYHSDNFSHNPFEIAKKRTIAVRINSILQVSPQSYEVHWIEESRDLNGVPEGPQTQWEAVLQTEIKVPDSSDGVVSNPLGFYVTNITWTSQQTLDSK
jgi:type IV secretory pathway TrbF-like protein